VVCLGQPDTSIIAVASLECCNDSSNTLPPWGSPAAQLLHNYEVSEGRIIQLLRQGTNAAAPQRLVPSVAISVEESQLSSCQPKLQDNGDEKEVSDVCKTERQSDASHASFDSSKFNGVSYTDQLATPRVFQAVEIEIAGRHAVVKRVMQVPPNSRASSHMSSRPDCSRTSSRGSASSMATSGSSGATTTSFQIGGKWYVHEVCAHGETRPLCAFACQQVFSIWHVSRAILQV
jgi:hypothetical protein